MKFEELKQREDLMVDFDTLSKEIDEYFENISKEKLKMDLESVGIEVKEIKEVAEVELESYLSQNNLYSTNKKKYIFAENDQVESSVYTTEDDSGELVA